MSKHIFKSIRKRAKYISAFFAINLLMEIIAPLKLMALTGGPSQPEVSSFEPVGTTDMVDLFTGDFNYNIPLFDIGGYPVNISYHGGISMDQEASWVGLGWNINPGAINRGMRGLPDDFLGDKVEKKMNIKKNVTLGITANTDLEIFGFVGQKKRLDGKKYSFNQSKKMYKLNKYNFGFGITNNNYRGIGYSLDLSAEVSKTNNYVQDDINRISWTSEGLYENIQEQNENAKKKFESFENQEQGEINLEEVKNADLVEKSTAKALNNPSQFFTSSKLKGNISLKASSQEGSSIGIGASYDYSKIIKIKDWQIKAMNPNIGLGYNSYLGVSSFDAGLSFSKEVKRNNEDNEDINKNTFGGVGGYIPIGAYSYVPQISMSTLSTSNSFNATIGFDAFGGHPNMRFAGFYNTEELSENAKWSEYPSYGYLYEQESIWNRGNENTLLDFNREKESNGNKNASHLPLANHTYDVYSVSGQGTGGMYRPHRKTIGLLYNNFAENRNKQSGMNDLGLELGFGANFRFGINYKNKVQRSSTGLWRSAKDNELINAMNYGMNDSNNNERQKQFYFKAAGEQTPSDIYLASIWGGKNEVSLKIGKTTLARNLRFGKVEAGLNQKPNQTVSGISKVNAIRSNNISFLTAEEASHQGIGMDPYIISYPMNYWSLYIKNQDLPDVESFDRYGKSNGAKAHHISEIISNGGDGMRYVYGIPAYNKVQEEVVFATSKDRVLNYSDERKEYLDKGLVDYVPTEDNSTNNHRGADNLFMSTSLPAYAHSYLLTGVLSPDYADLTGDGITDDDYGSAVKFNYHKNPGFYNWRTPYEENQATLDEGYKTDNSDSKGSYVYGEKEIWYLQSMESKTHVAEFKLSSRHDGHGTKGRNGGLSTSSNNTLMKLDSIVVYSKMDLLVNGRNAKPVKTIVFKYDYSLCRGISNSDNNEGKLTLKSIYFTYGNSSKGAMNPYRFTYSDFNPNYSHVHYDRWGNYKYANEKLPNRDFPYTDFDSNQVIQDKYAGAWNLSKVQLPSGGEINVEYEADDYAFVQDRRAMQMFKICGATHELNKNFKNYTTNRSGKSFYNTIGTLYDERKDYCYLYFNVDTKIENVPMSSTEKTEFFKKLFLSNGKGTNDDMLYFRFKVNMDPRAKSADDYEYVSGYANINTDDCGFTDDGNYAYVKLIQVNQGDAGLSRCHPVAKQAWQMGMQNLRKVMYPGSDQSQADVNGEKQSAMKALLNSYGQALNIFTGPYQNLRWKHIAKYFELNKSYIRLYHPSNQKIGGGSRVKKITINDNWSEMNTNQQSGQYGQEFYYKTKSSSGELISSGVASYEPFVGGDENPMRRPAFYHTNRFMFPDLNEYLEEPFGESFFPSPTVGYSRIAVRNIPKAGAVATSTGKVVHEFYTYKDFPLLTKNTNLRYLKNGNGNSSDESSPGRKRAKKFTKALTSLFHVAKRDYMVATQGYSIVLNDMHGKPKSMSIYSALDESSDINERQFTGRRLSGTEYRYKTELSKNFRQSNLLFGQYDSSSFKAIPEGVQLNNLVWVMKEDGTMVEKEIAVTYDIAVDTRESKSHYRHAGFDFNLENFMIFNVPCPYPKYSVTQGLFQSAVVTKVVQQYGVLEEVIAYDHSSIVRTKNLVWDEQTGAVLLTASTNEFEDPTFNFTYPAHLAYDRMGPSYKNIDHEAQFQIGDYGEVNVSMLNASSDSMFVDGDEVLLRQGDECIRGWVLKAVINGSNGHYKQLRIVDISGNPIDNGNWDVRVIRSGRRNLSAVPIGAVSTMYRRIFNVDSANRMVLNRDVVQSTAALFTDQWPGYLDKALYLNKVCDTISVGVNETYSLIKSMVETDSADTYYFNGSMLPPSANTLSSYTGKLKNSIETYARSLSTSECIGNKTLAGTYFGRTPGSPNTFFFKALYICNANNDSFIRNLTCEILVTKEDTSCGLNLDDLNAVGELNMTDAYNGTFTGYSVEDSCVFNISFGGNNCFVQVVCNYVPNCEYYMGDVINPYVNNLKGVWRQKEAFVYNSGRSYEAKSNNNTNIRKDGLITDYQQFWNFKDSGKSGIRRSNAQKWVSNGVATIYAPEGNGLEEKDALGIYSSQVFGYNNLLVTAQASNARHCQIAFDNFEDYFSPFTGCDQEKHFDFRYGLRLSERSFKTYENDNLIAYPKQFWFSTLNNQAWLSRDTAHTGEFSLCVKSGGSHSNVRQIDFSGISLNSGSDSFYRFKSVNDVITPFAPTPGKYVVSAWIYEKYSDQNVVNNYESAYVNVKIYNGGTAVVNKDFKASGKIINNWQRVEGLFEVPTGADSIKVTLVNGATGLAYFDDIRLHPFDSRMVGHVYHFTNLRVLAELDDNNYATYYEYDDEGTLIRVKRETENGIVTVQESRKSIRKKIN